jgi:hypothetical protein
LLGNLYLLAFGIVHVQIPFAPFSAFGSITGHDLAISLLSLAGVAAIAVMAIRETRALAVEDPPPVAPPRGAGSAPDLRTPR